VRTAITKPVNEVNLGLDGSEKTLVLSQIYADWLCIYLHTRFAASGLHTKVVDEENSVRWKRKKGQFFCDFTTIGSYLPAHKACCVGSAYRHHKAGQRGSLYLKGKWQKSMYKNK
jgi:hypothetical protein